MSYVDAREGTCTRLVASGLVGALQVGLGIAVVLGFAGQDFIRENSHLASQFFPAAPRTDPVTVPPPPEAARQPKTDKPVITPPTAFDDLKGSQALVVPIMPPAGKDIANLADVIKLPPIVPVDPSPAFTPKGASPRGNVSGWVTSDDYPMGEWRAEHEGLVRFRLSLDAQGRVVDCAITASSGYPALDAATCRFASQRARFDPATDDAGKPAASSWSRSVRWVIPKD